MKTCFHTTVIYKWPWSFYFLEIYKNVRPARRWKNTVTDYLVAEHVNSIVVAQLFGWGKIAGRAVEISPHLQTGPKGWWWRKGEYLISSKVQLGKCSLREHNWIWKLKRVLYWSWIHIYILNITQSEAYNEWVLYMLILSFI